MVSVYSMGNLCVFLRKITCLLDLLWYNPKEEIFVDKNEENEE